jgi:hypothetical protein
MFSPDVYGWVVTIAGPAGSLIVFVMMVYGSLKSEYRVPFAVLALSNVLFFSMQVFWLVIKVQQSVGKLFIPRDHAHLLFSVQALFTYLAVLSGVAGSALLVRQACRRASATNT